MNVMPRSLSVKGSRYQLNRLRGSGAGLDVLEKKISVPTGIRAPDRSAHSIISMPTTLLERC